MLSGHISKNTLRYYKFTSFGNRFQNFYALRPPPSEVLGKGSKKKDKKINQK